MDSTNDHNIDPYYRLLALCARADPHPLMDEQLKDVIKTFTAWNDLPAQAELHGMGPLLWHHLHRLDIKLPQATQRLITGLYLRHRALNLEHLRILLEVTSLLEHAGIRAVVLKGLALAYEYYPDPALRPASDIDLLLKKDDVLPAVGLLMKAGYKTYTPHADLEHLPKELKFYSPLKDGISIDIELHHHDPRATSLIDSSPDDEFIGFNAPPHAVKIGSQMIYCPDPIDHLDYLIRHLTRHMFAATDANPLPLKWIADIVSLVEHHAEQINWVQQKALINRLEVLYSLTPFPEDLSAVIPIKKIQIPSGVNQYPQGWPQHVFSEWKKIGFWEYIASTFASPSDWWMSLYYGIPRKKTFWFGQVVYRYQVFKMALSKLMRIKQ